MKTKILSFSSHQATHLKTYFFFFLISIWIDFFNQRAEASSENVHLLNPMVHVTVDIDSVVNKSEDFFVQFDLVILMDQDFNTANHINKICRKHKIRFLILKNFLNSCHLRFQAGGVFGWIGYGFFDFNNQFFLLYVFFIKIKI